MQELADQIGAPLVYLVDAAGARIDEQFDSYAGRHAWGNIFYNQVAVLRPGPAGVRPVRAVARRLGLRAGPVRRDDHGAGPRHRLPRLAAAGRDGDRRAGDAGGDGRRRDALPRLGPRATCSSRRTRRPSPRSACGCRTCPPSWEQQPPSTDGAWEPAAHRPIEEIVPAREDVALRHGGAHRRARRRGHLLPLQGPVRPGADHRFRPPRRPAGRHRRQPVDAPGRGAVLRLLRQGRPLHLDLQRLQRPAAVPRRHLGLHDRQPPSSARASSATAPRCSSPCASATVPRIAVLVRKAYGGGYLAMSGSPTQPGRRARAAHGQAGADGPGRGRQRHPLQPDHGDRGSRRTRRASSRRSGPRSRPSIDVFKLANENAFEAVVARRRPARPS